MSADAVRKTIPYSEVDRIREGREILRAASIALEETSDRLEASFSRAVTLLAECQGQVVGCGVGSAGRSGRAAGRCSLGQVAVPVGVGIGGGTGVPIVTSVVTAVI